ncbi:MAG: glycosyltransferase family 39 protein [Anaerolineae bacterium]
MLNSLRRRNVNVRNFWRTLTRPYSSVSEPKSISLHPITPLSRSALFVLVLLFLVIFASRVYRLPTLNMEKDEAWSVWITMGNLQQAIDWTPYDWPPGHTIFVYFWRALTGITPFGLRISTILTMLVTAALLFAVTRRLFGVKAGIMSVLAFSALGYVLFLSTILRAYTLILALFILSLWLMLRYFERPSIWRGVLLGLTLTVMFYIHTTTVIGMAMLALLSLLLFRAPRRWFTLWLLPGIIVAALCVPYLIANFYVVGIKNQNVAKFVPFVPTEVRIVNHYLDYLGQQPALFAALFIIATALLLDRWRVRRQVITLLIWMLMPLVLVFPLAPVDAFNPRHLSWVMVGLALWIGWGLSLLPRPALIAAALVLSLVGFDRIPLERYEPIPRLPFVNIFEELRTEWRGGDAILMDLICKDCIPIDAEEWDYFVRAYFPNGLPFITPAQLATNQYRRVWYVSTKGKETPETFAAVQQSRGMIGTIGPDTFLFRLYEAPIDPQGILFDNGMRFHGAELLNDVNLSLVWREGDTVRIRIFWSVDAPVTLDYSEGSYLWDRAKGVIAQRDDPPLVLNGPTATSQWIPGQIYIEERTLKLAYPLTTGDYDIMLSLYHFSDGVRISAPGVTQDNLLPLGTIYVKAW